MNRLGRSVLIVQIMGLIALPIKAQEGGSYIECLKSSFNGNHNFTAADVRSLCGEISGTDDPHYNLDGEKLSPSNKFTECFDQEKQSLARLDEEQAIRIAKALCRYEIP